jgi:LytR cell envelope-related transcriptional attenuator
MVLFALSFQDQVEKYGAYVGIAAFFGLAVLSLLYFAQARELKRLREWAGRAPDRARELEQRVVAQATATVARRPPAMPGAPATGAIAPPRRLAEMPVPPASAAAAQATQLAEAVEADPATNGNVGSPVPAVGPGGSVPAGPPPAVGPGGSVPAGPAPVNGGAPPEEQAPAEEPAQAAGANGGAAPVQRAADDGAGAGEERAPDAPSEERPAAPGETQPAGFPAAGGETVPGEIPPIPRATPAQRVGVTPRPAPMPLRQTAPTATPRGAARKPGAPAGRRPASAPPREGRSAGTIALLVGLAVLILGGGAFVGSQLLGGDDTPEPPNQAAPPPSETEDGSGGGGNGGGQGGEAAPPAETNVAVLNGTTFTGLAGQLADEVAAEGYERGVTETNTRDQTIQESVIYYADGFRASARAVGRLLSIEQLTELDSETAALAPGADVVVLAGADQAP